MKTVMKLSCKSFRPVRSIIPHAPSSDCMQLFMTSIRNDTSYGKLNNMKIIFTYLQ